MTFAPALSVPEMIAGVELMKVFEDPEWVSIMGNAMMEGIQERIRIY